ncbi:MAG: hypothetical protein J5545_10025 [Bacteroidaceae bacterium]|nr:hypothetical protein [Bacteroidaceae bacterium]
MTINYETTLKELLDEGVLSQRAYAALAFHHIRTIAELYEFRERGRLSAHYVGKKHLKEIETLLERLSSLLENGKKGGDIPYNSSLMGLCKVGLLSIRSYNSLKYAGFRTIGEVMDEYNYNHDFLLNLRNFGRKSMTEVLQLLAKIKIEEVESPADESSDYKQLPDELRQILDSAYEQETSGENDTQLFMKSQFQDAASFWTTVLWEQYDVLTIHQKLGIDGNKGLRGLYSQIVKIAEYRCSQLKHSKIVITINIRLLELAKILELHKNYLSPSEIFESIFTQGQQEDFESIYQELRNEYLSVRANHFCDNFLPTIKELIPYLDAPRSTYGDICPGQNMRLTLDEVYKLAQKLFYYLYNFAAQSWEEYDKGKIKRVFPFLSDQEIDFVINYFGNNKSLPLFMMSYRYLVTSSHRSDKVFCLLNGLYDGQISTLAEVGEKFGLTRERIRQLSCHKIDFQLSEFSRHPDWTAYRNLFTSSFITELSPKYRMIKEEESLPYDFSVFASIVCLVADFEHLQIRGKSILCSRRFASRFDFNTSFNNLEQTIKGKYSQDTIIQLSDFVKNVDEGVRDDALRLMTYYATEILDIKLDSNGCFTMLQNRIDVSKECLKILSDNGKPMSLDAIFTEFKRRYPYHKYESPDKVRAPLLKNEHVKPLGKTSTYALDSWQNIFFGSIRDLLRKTLEESPAPLRLDELIGVVQKQFPTSNAKSIATTMGQEDATDFVVFQGGFYGLAGKSYPSEYQLAEAEVRYTFAERMKMLEQFISTYRRFPFATGGEAEQGLQRWLYNVERQIIVVKPYQKRQLRIMLQPFRDAHIPENAIEASFLETCEQYKAFIDQEYELPSAKSGTDLFNWMKRAKSGYNGYDGNRRYYLTELFNYIHSLGFSI